MKSISRIKMKTAEKKKNLQETGESWIRDFHDFAEEAAKFDIRLEPYQQDQVLTYLKELLRWNRTINLTSIRKPSELLIKHVLDSLMPAALLKNKNTLVDLGTGAGFPGIPLKIYSPGLRLVLVESRRKKASFLEHAGRTLGLDNISICQARAEDPGFQDRFKDKPADTLITRAALKDVDTLKAGEKIIGNSGKILLMKGCLSDSDLDKIGKDAGVYGKRISKVFPYRLPGMENDRNIVVIEKGQP